MANEATLIVETAPPINMTVADGVGIEKGTVCTLSDPLTAAASTGISMFAGIAATEKIASDGNTKLGMYRNGIFKMYLSGSVAVGQALAINSIAGYRNYVQICPAAGMSGSYPIGIALETGTNGQTIAVELNPGVNPSV